MKNLLWILLFVFISTHGFTQSKYQKDFQQFWEMMEVNYAYFHQKQTDWAKVKQIYQPMADTVDTRAAFVHLLDCMILELYDGHISLNTNVDASFQLVPSNSDMYVAYQNGKYIVQDIRENYSAEAAGVKIGMEVLTIDGITIEEAVKKALPKSIKQPKEEVYTYVGNLVVAGDRVAKRVIEVSLLGKKQILTIGNPRRIQTNSEDQGLLGVKRLAGNIAYIKINNSLGNNDLIQQFGDTVDALADAKSIILDLRDTPSGGNTTVARAIMGKFIAKDFAYQKHIYPWEARTFGIQRSWVEYVSPNGKMYPRKVIVLVGRWTGSVGEAIALGFDRVKKAKVVGTPMAGLLGAIYCYGLSETGIRFCFPAEQLFHVNGLPREKYVPPYLCSDMKATYEKGVQLAK